MTISPELQDIVNEAHHLNHKVEIVSNVKSGKEATVYKVSLDGNIVAMKLYKKPEARSFKNNENYLLGKYYKRPSERRAVAKGNRFSKRLIHQNWVKREYFMLENLYAKGAKIPKPLLQVQDAIFMEFLGNQDYVASRLCDIDLTENEAESAYEVITASMVIFWNYGIVHADLSEYNILWWDNEPYIIDFPQAVDRRTNPNVMLFLDRDLQNITKYFSKYIEIDTEALRKRFSE